MSESQNIQENSNTVEIPQQKETINNSTPEIKASGIQQITTGRSYSNVFTNNELIQARDNILSSGITLKNTKLINILYNRLSPD
jgi:hypothetical protein